MAGSPPADGYESAPVPMKLPALLLAALIAASPLCAQEKSAPKKKVDKTSADWWPDNSKGSPTPHAPAENPPEAKRQRSQRSQAPGKGETIAFIGNGFAERETYYGRIETELQLRFPDRGFIVRNLGRSGDTPAFRPHPARASQWAFPGAEKFHPEYAQHNGKGFFSTPDQWLFHVKAGTIVAFFGYNESFDGVARVDNYEAELDAFVTHTLTKAYDGERAPRLALASPFAFEDLSKKRDLPDGKKENERLSAYSQAMGRVAQKHGLTFIDLFSATREAYAAKTADSPDYTINGFAPTDHGYRSAAKFIADALYGPTPRRSQADEALVNAAVKQKDHWWNSDYAIVNGVHTHGQRYNPFGPQNYPDEVRKIREMTALRDALIQDVAAGRRKDLTVDDSKTHPLPPVPTNYKPSDKNGDPAKFLSGEEAIAKMKLLPGFKVNLFADESMFPDLKKPVQMSFDGKGRLWVATTPTYPHHRPGDPAPDDQLLILEDTDGDGRADKRSVFADGLHLPIGFEIAPEGVYLSQEPNLALLIDDDKDGKADRKELILHGFDSHDTHHAISAYCSDASGAFYLLEGRFLHSQVETPYGPRRCNDGGAWRFDPKSFRLERFNQTDVSNPWGFSFNRWEQPHLSDASPGENWWALPLSAKMPYGIEIPKIEQFVPKRSRPSSGAEFVSSRHFPDEYQGDFMTCNTIGFLGISLGTPKDDGAGYVGTAHGDLIVSEDGNFRPVDLEFAPDGSLYFLDWQNPLIGHMQHNARDPNRDREKGRIYRITYPARPLLKPAKVDGATVAELLENLKEHEYRTRYRTRRELRGRPASEVLPAVKAWVEKLDPADPEFEHHLCEALWATWAQNAPDEALIRRLLSAKRPEARAAAADVVRHSFWKLPAHADLLLQAARDEHPRVRLTALVAASWMDNADGARIALETFRKPIDRWTGPVTHYVMTYTLADDVKSLVGGGLKLDDNPAAADYLAGKSSISKPVAEEGGTVRPSRKLTADEQKIFDLGKSVYFRDAHCATCHQADGKGLPNVYPPLSRSDWLENDERVIKIVLKGLWGPIKVSGKDFDPTKGVPPMMGFAGLLNDQEVAAVITFTRLAFGNNGKPVTAEQVAKVREATKDRVNFYMTEEILKEHPLRPAGQAKGGKKK